MMPLRRICRHSLGIMILAVAAARPVFAQLNDGSDPLEAAGVKIIEKNGSSVPLDLVFRDDQGREVKIGDYFNKGRPVLITLNYFGCPALCGLQLNGVLDILQKQKYIPGKEFELLTVSFEPLDTVEIAAAKKQNYIREYGRSEAAKGWHFLTGKVESIRPLTDALGFYYAWNKERQEWMHKAALIVCTPDGHISRYLGGVAFEPEALRLSIVEASGGKIGTLWDTVFFTCFQYDASAGSYVPIARNFMKLGGAVVLVTLATLILGLRSAEKRRNRQYRLAAGGGSAGSAGTTDTEGVSGDKGF